jgi:hypothetical protein
MTDDLPRVFRVEAEPQRDSRSYFMTVFVLPDGQLLRSEVQFPASVRRQPVALFLRTITGNGRVLLRCVSPIGIVGRDDDKSIERINVAQQKFGFGKICAVKDTKLNTYDLTVEADILFHPNTTQLPEVLDLVSRTCHCADHMEKALLAVDQRMDIFREDLFGEPQRD